MHHPQVVKHSSIALPQFVCYLTIVPLPQHQIVGQLRHSVTDQIDETVVQVCILGDLGVKGTMWSGL